MGSLNSSFFVKKTKISSRIPFLAEAGAAEPAGLGAGYQILGVGAGHRLT
jgi:hypothetical protein